MGRGKNNSNQKKGNKSSGKAKFRPQDPFYRGAPIKVSDKKDRAPKGDNDASDVPPIFGGGGMFGGGAGGAFFGKAAPAAKAGEAEGREDRKARKRAKKRGKGGGNQDEAVEAVGAGRKRKRAESAEGGHGGNGSGHQGNAPAVLHTPTAASPKLPKQRFGESAGEYSRRLDAAAKAQLRPVQKKMLTDHKRQRRKEREQAAKEKKRAAAKSASNAPDAAMLGTVDKPKFGDIVHRPPILGEAAMKSRSKLKSGKEKESAGAGISAASDLSDYASKVREAYENMKKKRQEAAVARRGS